MVQSMSKVQSNGDREAKTLRQWLERKCKEKDMSYRDAGKMAGISHATIGSIINGAIPSAATVAKLAKAFSEEGSQHRAELEDYLLALCGFRSLPVPPAVASESLTRLVDKLRHFDDKQLQAIERIIEFSVLLGQEYGEREETPKP